MKKLVAALALLLVFTSLSVQAQSPSNNKAIEPLLKSFEEAYAAKRLGTLDAERPFFGKVKFVIEHSLAEDTAKDRFEIKWFNNLEKAEQWLRSREREDSTPFREARPLVRCKAGLCTYNLDGGISHNHLYLRKIAYGYRHGRPYIKTIFLLDGD
jgi:hypothetical protein